MKLNLFSVPIYIGNIDVDKIKIEHKGFEETWFSKTKSSHNFKNKIEDNSASFILNCISKLISKDISAPHKLEITNIWENHYLENDFQEKHNHSQSHFSFIIYKKIVDSNTIFYNPSLNIIDAYYDFKLLKHLNYFDQTIKPECRSGQIIIFPSFIEHMVVKNNDSITIAGNINITIV